MKLVLLSGGSGTRLWPLSNRTRSKQFLKVLPGPGGRLESMVERVWRQLGEAGLQRSARLVAGGEQADILRSQLGKTAPIIAEPARRDTFPAVALAAAYLHDAECAGPEEIVAVLPVDPYVETGFFRLIAGMGAVLDETGADLALIGTRPDHPSEKFGYLVPADPGAAGQADEAGVSSARRPAPFRVAHFREKPDRAEAARLIRRGALWNCGVFVFRLGFMLQWLRERGLPLQYEALAGRYPALAKTSFDHAVVEKAQNIAAVRYDGAWKDLGTWSALTEELSTALIGQGVLAENSAGTHLINELDVPVAVLGIRDAIIAAGPDGVIVAAKPLSHKIKDIGDWFEHRPMLEEYHWGDSRVLDRIQETDGSETIVRRVRMKDGEHIGYHAHLQRRELWIVVAGEGEAVIAGRLRSITPGDVLSIPQGMPHGIRGLRGLVFLEIQRGAAISAGDVLRVSDHWHDFAALR